MLTTWTRLLCLQVCSFRISSDFIIATSWWSMFMALLTYDILMFFSIIHKCSQVTQLQFNIIYVFIVTIYVRIKNTSLTLLSSDTNNSLLSFSILINLHSALSIYISHLSSMSTNIVFNADFAQYGQNQKLSLLSFNSLTIAISRF